ncbi:FAD-dependent monooxygenase [Umezawaea sp. NPDC059074]|uniref:FAD-dependent monooxygenase n=1 Tax=Umezawaea sp. NPDC059074 TaxID=3346716 RepID=UPI0036CFF74D
MANERGGRALVVGAGIGGLATALRLRRGGWHVLVVEKAPELRCGGYVTNFSGVGYDAAEHLGLLPALVGVRQPMTDLVYVDESGARLAVLPAAANEAMIGPRSLTLLRGDLETVLHQALDEQVDLRFGRTVTEVEQDGEGVSVVLDDGTRHRVDLLVGADGVHSPLRARVFGPEERYRDDLGHAVASIEVDRTPVEVPPVTTMGIGLVGRGLGVTSLPDGRCAVLFAFRSDSVDADLAAGAATTLRRVFGDLGWLAPDLLSRVDRDESVYFDRICQIRMPRWHDGRIVLLGDSAWCVSLFAASGASLALGGAKLLGDLLDEHPGDVPAALAAWEERFRPVVTAKQKEALRATAMFVAPSAFAVKVRAAAFRLSGTRPVVWLARRFFGHRETAAERT